MMIKHAPKWEPADLPIDAEGNTKPGFACVHELENGNGPCSSDVFRIEDAFGDHSCWVEDSPVAPVERDPARDLVARAFHDVDRIEGSRWEDWLNEADAALAALSAAGRLLPAGGTTRYERAYWNPRTQEVQTWWSFPTDGGPRLDRRRTVAEWPDGSTLTGPWVEVGTDE
jgi:hypothetical protein